MAESRRERAEKRRRVAAEVQAQSRGLDRVLDRQHVEPARRAFEEQSGWFGRSMRRASAGRGRSPLDPASAVELVRAAAELVRRLFLAVARAVAAGSRTTLEEAVRQLARFVGVAAGRSRLDSDLVVRRLAALRLEEVRRMQEMTADALFRGAAERVRAKILAFPVGEASVNDALAAVHDSVDGEWWRVERVAKTEGSRAYNAARADAIAEIGRDLPGMRKRWTEKVSDFDGSPLDSKVGVDSLILHAQAVPVGGLFGMPFDPRVPTKMVGRSWSAPPNRPNDRAVLVPWAPGWHLPAWELRGGVRVPLG